MIPTYAAHLLLFGFGVVYNGLINYLREHNIDGFMPILVVGGVVAVLIVDGLQDGWPKASDDLVRFAVAGLPLMWGAVNRWLTKRNQW